MNKDMLKNIKILLIEDDDLQRNQLFTFLKRRVQKVYTAKNGEEGYDKYMSLQPDIILTDLRMPRVDGLELAKQVRQHNRLIPIIVATAMNDKETILKSIDVGITNYIVKPVDTDELMTILLDAVKTLLAINTKEFDTLVDKEKVNNLKNYLTKYLKEETSKGPSDIRIEITKSDCFIYMRDYLTPYEKSLIREGNNIQLVNHNRNIFFDDRKLIFEESLRDYLEMSFVYQNVNTKVQNNELSLHFTLN